MRSGRVGARCWGWRQWPMVREEHPHAPHPVTRAGARPDPCRWPIEMPSLESTKDFRVQAKPTLPCVGWVA